MAITNGNYSVSQRDCFNQPDLGSAVSYCCDPGFKVKGPSRMYCRKKQWVQRYDDVTFNVTCGKPDFNYSVLVDRISKIARRPVLFFLTYSNNKTHDLQFLPDTMRKGVI